MFSVIGTRQVRAFGEKERNTGGRNEQSCKAFWWHWSHWLKVYLISNQMKPLVLISTSRLRTLTDHSHSGSFYHTWLLCLNPESSICADINLFLKQIHLFILREWEREREREGERQHEWGRGRERERESQAGSTLPAQSLTWGSIPQTVRSWPEPKSRVRRLTDWATQVCQC